MEMKMQCWWDISQKGLTGHVSKFHLKKWDFFKNQILVVSLLNSVGSELKDFTTWSIKLK